MLSAAARGQEAVPEDLIKQAEKYVARLNSNDFDERESGLKRLLEMDAAVLPWIKERMDAKRPGEALGKEVRARLAQVVANMESRTGSAKASEGTQVALKLAGAGPKEIAQELERQTGNALPADFAGRLTPKDPADFSFTGSYWDAVDALLAAYPPKTDGKWKRENLATPRSATAWTEGDYEGWDAPHANAGICRVRVARVALEREAGGQTLAVVLSPLLESNLIVERLDLNVEVFKLAGGRDLQAKWAFEPVKRDRQRILHPADGSANGFAIAPASEGCFVAKARELGMGDRAFALEGTASATVRDAVKIVKTLRQWSLPARLPEGATAQIQEQRRDLYEVTVTGGQGAEFRSQHYTNCARFLDDKDQPVQARLATMRVQSNGQRDVLVAGYQVTVPFSKIEVTAMSAPRELEIPFKIAKIPLPALGE
ncbi:MAG: hypothetical protein KIS92_19775 [Planctomycetota bacterium]|nr:hypothetical protein [Planctomycetota bacterium]